MRPDSGQGSPYPSPGSPVRGIWPFEEEFLCKISRYAHGAADRLVNNRAVISFPPRFLIFLLFFPYFKNIYLFIYFCVSFSYSPKKWLEPTSSAGVSGLFVTWGIVSPLTHRYTHTVVAVNTPQEILGDKCRAAAPSRQCGDVGTSEPASSGLSC